MAENQQEQDRNEPATPSKLREAKKRGQVAKSLEFNSLAILSVGFAIFSFLGIDIGEQLLHFFSTLFANAHLFDGSTQTALNWYSHTLSGIANILWPAAGAIIVAGILANVSQTGFIFSGYPLKPELKKLNPVDGFKRVFSKKMLVEALKSVLKIVFFGAIVYFTIRSLLPQLLSMININIEAYPSALSENVQSVFGRLLIAVLIIALIDLAYTRWDFAKRMRMSRREIKEEVKRREGDPLVRAKLKELQREALKRAASIQNIPDADILITNPTHISIAIQYDRERMTAPIVSAKGAGDLALKMRSIAKKHNVSIIENKKLARHLFKKVSLEASIPDELFPAIAKMLAWVYLQKNNSESVS